MATRSPGPNKKSCQVWLDAGVKSELEKLAEQCNMSLHNYCASVLIEAVLCGALLTITRDVKIDRKNTESAPRRFQEITGPANKDETKIAQPSSKLDHSREIVEGQAPDRQ